MVGLIPESYFAPLDLAKIFGRVAPLHVDLGCGDGVFLFALAEQTPDKNFIGFERLLHRVVTDAEGHRLGGHDDLFDRRSSEAWGGMLYSICSL